MLAVSAEARQLLEEMRALSGTLQGLSQQKLNEDLSVRVLQIAERRMLSPEEAEKPDGADKPAAGRAAASLTTAADDSSTGFPWRELSWRGLFSPRALIWTAIIVIAAIIIHKNVPPENANRELAKVDEKKSSAGNSSAASVNKDKSLPQAAWVGPAVRAKDLGRDESKKAEEHFAGGAKAGAGRLVLKEKAAADKPLRDQAEAPGGMQRQLAKEAPPPGPAEELRNGGAMRKAAGGGAFDAKDGGGFGGRGGGGESQRRINEMDAAPSTGSLAANGSLPAPAMVPAPARLPWRPRRQRSRRPRRQRRRQSSRPSRRKSPNRRSRQNEVNRRQRSSSLTCSPAAARSGLFTELSARNGVVVHQLVGSAPSSQPSYAGVDNNGLAANGRPMLVNSATGDSSNRPQAAPQASGAVNPMQNENENVQNSASRAPPQNRNEQTLNGQARANYALKRGAESNASGPNVANGIAPASTPNQNSYYQQGATQTADAMNFAVQNATSGPRWFYFECDATDDQLHGLLKQLRERGDAFTLPEAAPSPDPAARVPRTPRDNRKGTVAKQEPGYYRYENPTASRGASQAPPAKGDGTRQSQADAEAVAAEKAVDPAAQRRANERAKPAAAQAKAASQPSAATGKTRHVVFVLNVVDRAAQVAAPPPPAPAASAPPAGK